MEDITLRNFALSLDADEYLSFLDDYYTTCLSNEELSKSVYLKMGKHRNPRGGLTKEGIEYYNRKTGSNLKPGVTWKPRTAEDFRRKGSFLVRFYTNLRGPLVDEKGQLTRLAKAARAWGEPAPTTPEAAAKLAAKGRRLLEKAKLMQSRRTKRVKASSSTAYEYYSIPSKNPDDYLVVEDRDKVSTYHLQVKENGKPNPYLMGAAWRALYHPSGHRGNRYQGPQRRKAKRKLKALYKSLGREMPKLKKQNLTQTEERQELGLLKSMLYNLIRRPIFRSTSFEYPRIRKYTLNDNFSNDLETDFEGISVKDILQQYIEGSIYQYYEPTLLDVSLTIVEALLKDIVVILDRFLEELGLEDSLLELVAEDLNDNNNDDDNNNEVDYYLPDVSDQEELPLKIPQGYIYVVSNNRDFIVRKYNFENYEDAISFVNAIYEKAEELRHHPIALTTIYNSPNTEVYVKFSTNDEELDGQLVELKTVTEKDIQFAEHCNLLYQTEYSNGQHDSSRVLSSNSDSVLQPEDFYFIDQLNTALSDLYLSQEIDRDLYEEYSENIFLDADKHRQAKEEAKNRFRVYPSVYANMWMVKRYKELGGRFSKQD